jgi:hypothetical protein
LDCLHPKGHWYPSRVLRIKPGVARIREHDTLLPREILVLVHYQGLEKKNQGAGKKKYEEGSDDEWISSLSERFGPLHSHHSTRVPWFRFGDRVQTYRGEDGSNDYGIVGATVSRVTRFGAFTHVLLRLDATKTKERKHNSSDAGILVSLRQKFSHFLYPPTAASLSKDLVSANDEGGEQLFSFDRTLDTMCVECAITPECFCSDCSVAPRTSPGLSPLVISNQKECVASCAHHGVSRHNSGKRTSSSRHFCLMSVTSCAAKA